MSSSSICKRANKAYSLSYISNMLNPLVEHENINNNHQTKDEILIDLENSVKSVDDIIISQNNNNNNNSCDFNHNFNSNKNTNVLKNRNSDTNLIDEMEYFTKKIKLTDNEIYNHIFFALFDKSKSEHFTCMHESLATLDSLNKKFKFQNYTHLLQKVYPYLNNKSKNGVSRCYFSAIQINVAQYFKTMDKDFDRRLSFSEFYHGIINILYETDKDSQILNKSSNLSHNTSFINTSSFDCDDIFKMVDSCQLEIDDKAIFNLFKRFDTNEDGFISFNEFVKGFNVPMCKQRINILNKAFDKLGEFLIQIRFE
jgi:Ca2+-binding EF-hand superfamily protein